MGATEGSSPLSVTSFDTSAKSQVQRQKATVLDVAQSSRELRQEMDIWLTINASHEDPLSRAIDEKANKETKLSSLAFEA
jgi:hypothetical protein